MALISCPECGQQISDQAAACPHCGMPAGATPRPRPAPESALPPSPPIPPYTPPLQPSESVKQSNRFGCLIVVVIVLLAAVVLFALTTPKFDKPPSTSRPSAVVDAPETQRKALLAQVQDTTAATSMRLSQARQLVAGHAGTDEAKQAEPLIKDLEAALAVEQEALEKANRGKQWSYNSFEDGMAGKPVRTATVTSSNTFNLDFPYKGEQHARLQLRRHPRWGNDVMVHIEQGQILCSRFTQCPVRVRFDDGDAITFQGGEPEDNSSDTVFIKGYDRFTSRMAKAKRVRIELNFYREGMRVLDFEVEGFDWDRKD